METEVLVVGAGPTGLLLAAELRRRGVDCRLIDSLGQAQHWDRATVVHPRSLEVFESLGIVDRFLDAGVPQRGARLHSAGDVVAELDFSASRAPYPYNVGLSEEATEGFLDDYLHDHGGTVERGVRLVELEAGEHAVRATLERDGTRTAVSALWVVGCDGYRSVTRQAAGIGLQGHDIAEPWAVFDVTLAGRDGDFETTLVYLEQTMVILTPLPGRRYRVYTRPSSRDADFVAEAAAVLALYEPDAVLQDIANAARFRCHAKVAERYRAGRILLAGDAAHVCSPDQGHGMNCGIQDAQNLGWKLALVRDGAAPGLLDSYAAERRPVALEIAESGEAMEAMGRFDGSEGRTRRDLEVRTNFASSEVVHNEAVAEAELNIDYRSSPIVVSGPDDRPVGPGDRLPDLGPVQLPGVHVQRLHQLSHRPGHTLIALARGESADELPALLRELQQLAARSMLFDAAFALATEPQQPAPIGLVAADVADALGVSGLTLLAVRPDRHIGFRADRADTTGLQRYAALLLGSTG